MADISKINAVALADIAKLDAVLAANIAKVNGLVFTTAAGAFLLDTYTGAAAGYSVRRLATSATVLLRVRRDTAGGTGDDDEADVAYDSNNILSLDSAISNASVGVTATTLGQFLNVGTVNGTTYTNPDSLTVTASCFVDTWYDQAGSNNAEQATHGSQPQIHDGTVNTDLITENGQPALQYDGIDDEFADVTLSSAVNQNNMASFGVGRWAAASPAFPSISNLRTAQDDAFGLAYRGDQYLYNDIALGSHGANDFTQRLWSGYADNASSDVKFYRDGVQQASTTPVSQTHSTFHVGGLGHTFASTRWNGYIQEVVLFGVSTKSDHTGIETNINSDYLIYQPTDAPTSGLLATYTGAAAAYSVRQLSDKAVIAMRIRRDSDDEERNIGFDANGDLDTTAISDFCQTANGYVTRWADQSTEGNHADQATDASQPQIYNGAAVVTENGKPALVKQGSAGAFSGPTFSGTVLTAFVVSNCGGVGNRMFQMNQFFANGSSINQGTTLNFSSTDASNQALYSLLYDTTDQAFLNGSSVASGDAGTTSAGAIIIGGQTATFRVVDNMQEIIFYQNNTHAGTTPRTGIESDIDTYFSIT